MNPWWWLLISILLTVILWVTMYLLITYLPTSSN
jgi:hypothetical protein